MQIVLEYLSYNYMTLMLLAGLTVILTANRKTKINGVQYVWGIMAIVLVLTICEYAEVWCDTYSKDYRILYPKTMLVYWLFPMTALLEIYLVVPIKRKLLLAVPQIVNMILTLIDLSGTGIVYSFNENHAFIGGVLRPLPLITVGFYVVLLTICSIQFISHGSKSKGIIVIFMAVSTLITISGEYTTFAEGYTESIAAMDMLVYYFYLAAIHHSEVQKKFYQQKLELEQSKNTLLTAQIQPHFINHSMLAVQELCYQNPEQAAKTIGHFSSYLQNRIETLSYSELVSFEYEIQAVREYLALEYADPSRKFKTEYQLEETGFLVPALSVQPLVENAVRHGINRRSPDSWVKVSSWKDEDYFYIAVEDNGTAQTVQSGTGIGIENIRTRIALMCGGTLIVNQSESGTKAEIHIPKDYGGKRNVYNHS